MEAVKKAGNIDLVTHEMEKVLDNYDGCEAKKSDWKDLVLDTEEYIVIGKDGTKDFFPPEGIVED